MRYLVDSSMWVRHLRTGDPILVRLLEEDLVLVHPFVIGDLACGNARNREEILDLLSKLPECETASQDECLYLLRERKLYAAGLGWKDVHLIAAARLSRAGLMTRDARLRKGWEAASGSR